MDPVTHAATGYVISHVLFKESYKEKGVSFPAFSIATMLAAVSPDIDAVVKHVGGQTIYFMNHRGITHSPFALVILALSCALIVKLLKRGQNYPLLFFGALLGAISHVLLDLTNTYSTLAFWPFSNKMYSMNLTSIIDVFIISLYILTIPLSFFRLRWVHSRKMFTFVLAAIVCYFGVKFYMQQDIRNYLLEEYRKGSLTTTDGQNAKKVLVMGDFMNINSWNFIIENEQEFIKGKIRYGGRNYSHISVVKKIQENTATRSAAATPLGQFLLRFSPFIAYHVDQHDGGYLVRMMDLRFTFSIIPGKEEDPRYIHTFGGYITLDSQYKPTAWSVINPQSD